MRSTLLGKNIFDRQSAIDIELSCDALADKNLCALMPHAVWTLYLLLLSIYKADIVADYE